MTTLVTGATSQIGHFFLPKLAGRGEPVVALSRRRRTGGRPNEHWISAGLADAADLPDIDSIVSFGPMDALAQWLQRTEARPRRLVATSSMSAESKRDAAVEAERAIAHRLLEGERALVDLCRQRGIAWTILRPTLIYGAGLDRSLTPIARRAMRWRLFPLPPGTGLRQPVHADDVAEAALRALDRCADDGVILPVGGGERLSAADMFRRVRASLPVATLPVPVPALAVRVAARVRPSLRGPLSRLDADLVADNTAVQRRLGLAPRGFRPVAETWGLRPR